MNEFNTNVQNLYFYKKTNKGLYTKYRNKNKFILLNIIYYYFMNPLITFTTFKIPRTGILNPNFLMKRWLRIVIFLPRNNYEKKREESTFSSCSFDRATFFVHFMSSMFSRRKEFVLRRKLKDLRLNLIRNGLKAINTSFRRLRGKALASMACRETTLEP